MAQSVADYLAQKIASNPEPPASVNLERIYLWFYKLINASWELLTTRFPLLPKIWFWYQLAVYSLSIVVAVIVFYLSRRILAIRRQERADLEAATLAEALVVSSTPENKIWLEINQKIQSENPADWKMAIIEADNLLDDLTKRIGYRGENLGERLKAVEPSDFTTLNDAWEAHKVRNQIAHEAGFALTRRQALIAISQYEKVFKEFELI